MAINPLTREQKLLAELVIQVGNISEALQTSSSIHTIQEIQTQLAEAAEERSVLTAALTSANSKISELQSALTVAHPGDVTPDNVGEVMNTLNINFES
mgnify:CR=1 FL=1